MMLIMMTMMMMMIKRDNNHQLLIVKRYDKKKDQWAIAFELYNIITFLAANVIYNLLLTKYSYKYDCSSVV